MSASMLSFPEDCGLNIGGPTTLLWLSTVCSSATVAFKAAQSQLIGNPVCPRVSQDGNSHVTPPKAFFFLHHESMFSPVHLQHESELEFFGHFLLHFLVL